jgi:MYXO-CTERM domain-containing protein
LTAVLAAAVMGTPQGPAAIEVGRVTVVYWPGMAGAAAALGELADGATHWPGIANPPLEPIRLVLAPDERRFDSITAGRLPEWGAAATFPGSRTVILTLSPDHRRVLRHELAHLALHSVVGHPPRWFDEGYAARAAGEWDRLGALKVNWAVLRGLMPTLDDLNRGFTDGGSADAETAYALATSAVVLLERLGGDRGLAPLIGALSRTGDFDLAVRSSYQITLGQFERLWRHELRTRYGWLLFITSFTVLWGLTALVLAALWAHRRRRDRARYLALDEGWEVPEEEWNPRA